VEVFEEGHRTGVTPQLTRHVTKIFQHAFHKVREWEGAASHTFTPDFSDTST
jgi:hypothetical protein